MLMVMNLDWEQKPSDPSSIRLIHFGQLLDEAKPLKGMKLPITLYL
jgi:hypothetical protein